MVRLDLLMPWIGLVESIAGGVDPERERFLAAELAQADAARFDPELRQYNDFRAEAESQAIAREFFGGYGSGSMADDAIGRIAEIRKLGGTGVLSQGENAQVVRYDSDVPRWQPKNPSMVFISTPIAVILLLSKVLKYLLRLEEPIHQIQAKFRTPLLLQTQIRGCRPTCLPQLKADGCLVTIHK